MQYKRAKTAQDVLHMDVSKDTPTLWKTFTFMFVSKLKCLNWIFTCRFAIHLINVYKERHLWSVWAQFCSNTNSHSGKNVSFKILFPENVNSYPPSNSYICVSCQHWAGKNLCKLSSKSWFSLSLAVKQAFQGAFVAA